MSDFKNRIGFDNFVWWLGVVEDRQDPLDMGRCRVRIFGWHTDNKQEIPTESLPWSQPMLPVNGSLVSGTAQEGDYVFGFFFDGMSGQIPCLMGIFPGIPQQFANPEKGFTDQRTDESLSTSPKRTDISGGTITDGTAKRNPMLLGEPTTSRVARNKNIQETIIGYKQNTLDGDVQIAGGGVWQEPTTPYAARAPYNRVTDSESGHIMEFDDTPNAERVHIAHRKGSFVEFHPDGSKVTKVVGTNYEIMLEDNNVHIKGGCNITVDGDCRIMSQGMTVVFAKDIALNADTVTVAADLDVIGNITTSGTIVSDGDITGAGISVSTHVHSGVTPGSGQSGTPQS